MTQAAHPVARLRDSLQTIGLDGWYIGREDMFQGEEVPPSEERSVSYTHLTLPTICSV